MPRFRAVTEVERISPHRCSLECPWLKKKEKTSWLEASSLKYWVCANPIITSDWVTLGTDRAGNPKPDTMCLDEFQVRAE